MSECKTVTLRTRPLKKGMLSFYLDYYPGYRDQETMKTIRHEGLNIYIYANPKNQRERDFNAAMSEKAEAIRCRRFEAIVNERYDFFDKRKYKADFLEYYRKQLRKHDQKWGFVYQHFYNFVHGKCTFEEIDVDLCNKFREYLLNAKQLRRDGQISKNSASGYWSTFRGFLKILYRNRRQCHGSSPESQPSQITNRTIHPCPRYQKDRPHRHSYRATIQWITRIASQQYSIDPKSCR